jgi:hypothetical protein
VAARGDKGHGAGKRRLSEVTGHKWTETTSGQPWEKKTPAVRGCLVAGVSAGRGATSRGPAPAGDSTIERANRFALQRRPVDSPIPARCP